MATKVKISEMLGYYAPHAVRTSGKMLMPPKEQYGYVMGGDGRIADDKYLLSRAKSSYPEEYRAAYNATRKWLGHIVQDCNAVAEAFYKRTTGTGIDTKARLNYANWCGKKGNIGEDLPQLPGVALFSGSSTGSITHVGFLLCKYGQGTLDWYVLEARGRDYGLVVTKLVNRPWKWWGVMDRYFDYDIDRTYVPPYVLGTKGEHVAMEGAKMFVFGRGLRRGCRGEDVRNLQQLLGTTSVDGIFGKDTERAVAEFKKNRRIGKVGVAGAKTIVALGGKWIG